TSSKAALRTPPARKEYTVDDAAWKAAPPWKVEGGESPQLRRDPPVALTGTASRTYWQDATGTAPLVGDVRSGCRFLSWLRPAPCSCVAPLAIAYRSSRGDTAAPGPDIAQALGPADRRRTAAVQRRHHDARRGTDRGVRRASADRPERPAARAA